MNEEDEIESERERVNWDLLEGGVGGGVSGVINSNQYIFNHPFFFISKLISISNHEIPHKGY